MSFASPWMGLCALGALLVLFFARRSRAPLPRRQLALVTALQALAVLAFAFALAEPWRSSDGAVHRLAIAATGDREARETLARWRAETSARDPFHALSAGSAPALGEPATAQAPAIEGTPDLAAALRAALALVPCGARGEIALASDGRHDGASVLELAAELGARAIPLHLVSAAPAAPPNAPRLLELTHASRVAPGEALRVLASIDSPVATRARLVARRGERVLAERELALRAGAQRAELELVLGESGPAEFELALESAAPDAVSRERSAVLVDAPLEVLHLAGDASRRRALASTLAPHGLRTLAPEDPLATAPEELARAAAVIVDELAAERWSAAAQTALRDAVELRGTGLLLAGTHANLGPGGYGASPLAPILPVRLPQREERRDPSVALVVVLDTSGSMGGGRIELAKEVARLAISTLQPHDKVGIVEFYGSKRWAAPLQPASNAIEITRALNRLQAGGGTVIYDALEESYYALLNAQTRFQHVLVLTDGGVESGPFEALARRMSAAGQNISTVLIGPQANSPFLMSLAQWGRGRFYSCPDRFQLPELRFREPQSSLLPSVEERTLGLERTAEADALKSFDDGPLPPAGAVVEAGVRDGAEVLLRAGGKPYLVGWDRGAGRVLVLAGEMLGESSALLRGDPAYGAFLADLVRDVAAGRRGAELALSIRTQERGARIELVIPRERLLPRAPRVRCGAREVALSRSAERRYEAFLPWSDASVHLIEALDGEDPLARGAACAPLPRASRARDVYAELTRVARTSGGEVVDAGADLPREPRRARASAPQAQSLVPHSAALAIALFLAALLARRWPFERLGAAARIALVLCGLGALPGAARAQEIPDDDTGIRAAIGAELRARGELDALRARWQGASSRHHLLLALADGDLARAEALLADEQLAREEPELGLRLALVRGRTERAVAAAAALAAAAGGDAFERAEHLLLRAGLAAELGRAEEARAALASAVELAGEARFRDRAGLVAAALGYLDLALEWHRPEALQGKLAYQCALRRGVWRERVGALQEAAVEYADAVARAPLERDAAFAIARWVAVERRAGSLGARCEAWLARLREDAEAFPPPLAGALLESLRELGRAEEAWLALRALPAAVRERFAALAVPLALESGRIEAALAELRARVEERPADVERRIQLALLYSDLQRDGDAAAVLLERSRGASRPELRRTATAATELGLDAVVARCAEALRALGEPADRIDAALVESAHELRRGRREDAARALLAVEEPSAAPADRLRLGEALESAGRSAEALKLFEQVYQETRAEDLGLRLAWMLAQSRDTGERDRALAIYRRLWLEAGSAARRVQAEEAVLDLAAREGTLADLALELEEKLADPAFEAKGVARDALVKIHTRAKDSLGAAALLRAWMRAEPAREIDALEQLARVHLANDEHRAYGRVLEELIAKNPTAELDYRQQLALAALERGRPAEARRCLAELLRREGELGATELEFAAGIYTLAGQHEDAVRLYRRSLALHPERVETFLLLGNALKSAGQQELGVGLFQTLLLDDLPDDLFVVAVDGLLNLEADRAALRAAAASVRLRLAERPEQVFLQRLLQDVLEAVGEGDARLLALEETVLVGGEQRVAFVRELMQEAETRRDRRAYLEHGRALLLLGDEVPPSIFLTLGEALLKEGELDAATRAFERARLAPDFASVETRIAELFESAQRLAEAERARQRLLRRTPDDPQQLIATARLCEQRVADERALALYLRAALHLLPRELESAAQRDAARVQAAAGTVSAGSVRIVPMPFNRNRAGEGPSFADALQGALRCAGSSSELQPLVDELWARFERTRENELALELALAAPLRRIAEAYDDRALAQRLESEQLARLAASGEDRARRTALAAARLASQDYARWAALGAEGKDWSSLRWLFVEGRWEELRERASGAPPNLRAELGRCYLLAARRADAEAIAAELEQAALGDDAAGEAYARLAEWLGRPIDEAALASRRLAKALASTDPPQRRVRAVLSAVQAHPALPAPERRAIYAALAAELASSTELPLLRSFLDQAGSELEAEIAAPLIARLFEGPLQPYQVSQDAKHLALLAPEQGLVALREALQKLGTTERRTQVLRIAQMHAEKLSPELLRALLADLDLRRLERTEGYPLVALGRDRKVPAELVALLVERLRAVDPKHSLLPVLELRASPEPERCERARAALLALESAPKGADDFRPLVRNALVEQLDAGTAFALASELGSTGELAFRAELLERAGRSGEAAELLLAAARKDPQELGTLYRAARLLKELERYEEARELYRLAKQHSPQFYVFQARELAVLELRSGDARAALEALQGAEDSAGQALSIWLEVIAALPDAELRRTLLRRLSAQPESAMRSIAFFGRASATREDTLAAAVTPPPFPPPQRAARSSMPDGTDADAAVLLAEIEEGTEHVERLLRSTETSALQRDEVLLRAKVLGAARRGTWEALRERTLTLLRERPFEPRSMGLLTAAQREGLALGAEATDLVFRWRASAQQLDARTLADLYLASRAEGLAERTAALRGALLGSRAFLVDGNLLEAFVPGLFAHEATLEELLALAPPPGAPLDPRLDAELLGALLLRGADLDRLQEVFAARLAERIGENLMDVPLLTASFGLRVARGELEGLENVLTGSVLRMGHRALPAHALGAAIPPLALWRRPELAQPLAELLLLPASSGAAEARALHARLAAVLAARLAEAGRGEEAGALRARLRALEAGWKPERWLE